MLKRDLLFLLLISTIIRCLIALLIPLGNDEVYYLLYARFPDVHYYDHPLLIGWAVKFFTANLYFQEPFFYRLPGIILSIPATFFVYQTASCIQGQRAAWIAACLFTASFYVSIICGVFIMPDSVQLVFWTGALYMAALIFFKHGSSESKQLYLLLWFGFIVGFGMLAKYHSVFLWVGLFVFVVLKKLHFLLKWQFWLAIFITMLFLTPMIYWNYINEWVGFNFYSARVGVESRIRYDLFVKEFVGEILYQNPVVWIFVFLFAIIHGAKITRSNARIFLLCMALPLIFFLWSLSLFRETLPHWSGPAYIPLIILASIVFADNFSYSVARRWIISAFSLISIVLVLGYFLINFYPSTIGSKKAKLTYGSGDFTLDMYGWKETGIEIGKYLKINKLDKLPVVSPNWFPAAHIDEYVTRKTSNPLFGVGSIAQMHHYQWVNKKRGGIPRADSMLYIVPSNYYKDPVMLFDKNFKKINLIGEIPEYRSGKPTRYFFIYLLSDSIEPF
jgi:hypothetical protein